MSADRLGIPARSGGMVSLDPMGVKPAGRERGGRSAADAWVVLGLGSNVGDRGRFLADARARLARGGFCWTERSSVWETDPIGGPPGQRQYLNQVVAAPTRLVEMTPRELLELCRRLEHAAGRCRRERWGPRTIDVDILLFGNQIVSLPDLAIPHPRFAERGFAVGPVAELLPEIVHPGLGITVRQIWRRLRARPGACPGDQTVSSIPSART